MNQGSPFLFKLFDDINKCRKEVRVEWVVIWGYDIDVSPTHILLFFHSRIAIGLNHSRYLVFVLFFFYIHFYSTSKLPFSIF